MTKSRWFQFDLRTLLVLVLVLAVPLGWHQYVQMRQRRQARRLEAANGTARCQAADRR